MLTQERLKEVLEYNTHTGEFTWKVAVAKRIKVGEVAGCHHRPGHPNSNGWKITVDKRTYCAHRLVWLYVHGRFPDNLIDHINGNNLDNRLVNLREATHSQNSQNFRQATKRSTTGLLGVRIHKYKGAIVSFWSSIRVDGELQYLGSFKTPEEAHEAYLEAKRKLHPYCTI